MGLEWIISILWTFKEPPTASRIETGTFREFFLLLCLHFLSDGNGRLIGKKLKQSLKIYLINKLDIIN